MPPIKEVCPYHDKPCPKIDEIKQIAQSNNNEVQSLRDELKTISKTLYMIIGAIMIGYGLTGLSIW